MVFCRQQQPNSWRAAVDLPPQTWLQNPKTHPPKQPASLSPPQVQISRILGPVLSCPVLSCPVLFCPDLPLHACAYVTFIVQQDGKECLIILMQSPALALQQLLSCNCHAMMLVLQAIVAFAVHSPWFCLAC